MTSIPLVPTLVPARGKLAELAIVASGVAMIAVAAQIVIPLPITPVPLTGQTFAVLLVGASFGALRGTMTLLAYLAVGFAGLPVFAEGNSGFGILTAPSAGYLVGMVAAAALVGVASERGWDRTVPRTALTMVAGNLVIYAFGLTWLGLSLGAGLAETLVMGVVPFLIGDAIKIALATGTLPSAWWAVRKIKGLPGRK
ncbi:biotin transporter BioY [Saccharomonospora sp.]|uniref:biotin transporter BioY n=1 Tax=Saccharomonospora sp. TaxID=33913 RepID=UPI00262B6213|nr:biotin transporter BioY [Saccharomonospora sp.]